MTDELCTSPALHGAWCAWQQGHGEHNPNLCQGRVFRVDLTDAERTKLLSTLGMTVADATDGLTELADFRLGSPEWLSAYRTLRGDGE